MTELFEKTPTQDPWNSVDGYTLFSDPFPEQRSRYEDSLKEGYHETTFEFAVSTGVDLAYLAGEIISYNCRRIANLFRSEENPKSLE